VNQHGLKVAVIVNEIGDIGIDSELIIATDDDLLELSNGCICCSINNDLADAVFRVLGRDETVDYLVVESTGIADPLPIGLFLPIGSSTFSSYSLTTSFAPRACCGSQRAIGATCFTSSARDLLWTRPDGLRR
jgi:CobW/HypB/UreG, nucleotide-binding domain